MLDARGLTGHSPPLTSCCSEVPDVIRNGWSRFIWIIACRCIESYRIPCLDGCWRVAERGYGAEASRIIREISVTCARVDRAGPEDKSCPSSVCGKDGRVGNASGQG